MKRPEFLRKILKSTKLKSAFAYILHLYARFAFATTRWQYNWPDNNPTNIKDPKIYVFWHSRLFLMSQFRPKDEKTYVMISFHNDGMIVAKVMDYLGLGVVSGSRRKGGATVARMAITQIENGHNVSITPDGPRGPNQIAADGAIIIGSITGAPLIPVTYSVSLCRKLASWDRFVFPFPFAKGYFECAEPIYVPKNLDDDLKEEYRLKLQSTLNTITARADEL